MPEETGVSQPLPRPEAVGDLLEDVLADLGLTDKLEGYRAVLAWEEVAGPSLAEHAQALRFHRGKLELAVPSGVWRTQLSFSKRQLIERLNQRLGKTVVRDLIFTHRRRDGDRARPTE